LPWQLESDVHLSCHPIPTLQFSAYETSKSDKVKCGIRSVFLCIKLKLTSNRDVVSCLPARPPSCIGHFVFDTTEKFRLSLVLPDHSDCYPVNLALVLSIILELYFTQSRTRIQYILSNVAYYTKCLFITQNVKLIKIFSYYTWYVPVVR
jgi:hypothetical protein